MTTLGRACARARPGGVHDEARPHPSPLRHRGDQRGGGEREDRTACAAGERGRAESSTENNDGALALRTDAVLLPTSRRRWSVGRAVGPSGGRAPVGRSASRAVGRAIGRTIGRPGGRAYGQAVRRAVGRTVGRAGGRAVDGRPGWAVGRALERSKAGQDGRVGGRSVGRAVGHSKERSDG